MLIFNQQRDNMSNKPWISCAQWKDGLLSFSYDNHNNTRDSHYTKTAAQSVCRTLERDGLGGEKCHFTIRTWAEEEDRS